VASSAGTMQLCVRTEIVEGEKNREKYIDRVRSVIERERNGEREIEGRLRKFVLVENVASWGGDELATAGFHFQYNMTAEPHHSRTGTAGGTGCGL
jgi:hypothetical protein